MERGLKTVLLFLVGFPLFGGVVMAALLLIFSLLLSTPWQIALVAMPYAYAFAFGAAGIAGIGFALVEGNLWHWSQPRRILLGAICGGGAVWLEFPREETFVFLAMPALGAASGALCGHLAGLISTSGRSVRALAGTASGLAILVCGAAIIGLWSYRMVVFYAVT